MREIAGNIFRPGEIKRNELVIRSSNSQTNYSSALIILIVGFYCFVFLKNQSATRRGCVHEAHVEEARDVVRLRGDRTQPHLQQQICGQNAHLHFACLFTSCFD